MSKESKKKLSIAWVDVSFQTALLEKAREQLEVKVAELKEMQSRQEMRKDDLITTYEAQTKVATKLEQMRTKTAK